VKKFAAKLATTGGKVFDVNDKDLNSDLQDWLRDAPKRARDDEKKQARDMEINDDFDARRD